jgi:hypothetical protein
MTTAIDGGPPNLSSPRSHHLMGRGRERAAIARFHDKPAHHRFPLRNVAMAI